MGILDWDQCLDNGDRLPLQRKRKEVLLRDVRRSLDYLDRKDYRFFSERLPTRELWRSYPEFQDSTAFLDIETTGLSSTWDDITVIGLYDGNEVKTFIRGINLNDFPKQIEKYSLIVSYNGSRFDLPFILEKFPSLRLDHIHIDLMYPLRRIGLRGGLKAIERQVGIKRTEETAGLSGWDAVRLWKEFERGNENSLELLIEYNKEDIVDLEALMRLVYDTLRRVYLP